MESWALVIMESQALVAMESRVLVIMESRVLQLHIYAALCKASCVCYTLELFASKWTHDEEGCSYTCS